MKTSKNATTATGMRVFSKNFRDKRAIETDDLFSFCVRVFSPSFHECKRPVPVHIQKKRNKHQDNDFVHWL